MRFKVICYDTLTQQKYAVYKRLSFEQAMEVFTEQCAQSEATTEVRMYKGFVKITSCFMGSPYYQELMGSAPYQKRKESRNRLKQAQS